MPRSDKPARRYRPAGVLAGLLLLVFAIGAAGSYVTLPKIPGWYAQLAKPSFAPPNWVFGPVWTALYVAMALAAWRVWRAPASSARHHALIFFFVQLALNALWSPVFFGLEAPRLALAAIVALLAALAITTWRFFQCDRIAGWLLVPYLAWVAFATILNGAIAVMN